jgi:hypothetical protein
MLLHAFRQCSQVHFVNFRRTDSTVLLNICTEHDNYQFLSYDIESAYKRAFIGFVY